MCEDCARLPWQKTMRENRRDLMAKRKIDDAQLMAIMQMSEQQVFDWHKSLRESGRSALLTTYFHRFSPRRR